MFDLRYHVASLAAVFLALVIGILVGVGIADTGVQEDSLRGQIALAERERDEARNRVAFLERHGEVMLNFERDAYPALMNRRLAGKRVALVFVGSVDDGVRGSVERTLEAADGQLARMRALRLPVEPRSLLAALGSRALVGEYTDDNGLVQLGRDLARELTAGGDTPLWDALGGELVEEQSGDAERAVDGVVVARTSGPQRGATARFLTGFYTGLADSGVPAIGVETSGAASTAVGLFKSRGLSSVDDVETATGRLALALLLSGADEGQYGLRSGDGPYPPIEPVEPVD
ncbi:MAG: copper transporter [Gaiellaceae bacterium]